MSQKKVTINIDGINTEVSEGKTVLEAARELDIDIPTLCYHEALEPFGSCRMCIAEMSVEKNGSKKSWIGTTCTTPVQEGLTVKTNTTKIKKERKLILELLISRAPDSIRIQELAKQYGVEKTRFVTLDEGESNCILCGLCVRVCDEVIQAHAIGTAYRGIQKKVLTPFEIAKDKCLGCGACAYVCPTGAIKIIEEKPIIKIENWNVEHEMAYCKECGKPIGPKVFIDTLKEKVPVREEMYDLCPECRRKAYQSVIV